MAWVGRDPEDHPVPTPVWVGYPLQLRLPRPYQPGLGSLQGWSIRWVPLACCTQPWWLGTSTHLFSLFPSDTQSPRLSPLDCDNVEEGIGIDKQTSAPVFHIHPSDAGSLQAEPLPAMSYVRGEREALGAVVRAGWHRVRLGRRGEEVSERSALVRLHPPLLEKPSKDTGRERGVENPLVGLERMESQSHRVMERFRLEGTLKITE